MAAEVTEFTNHDLRRQMLSRAFPHRPPWPWAATGTGHAAAPEQHAGRSADPREEPGEKPGAEKGERAGRGNAAGRGSSERTIRLLVAPGGMFRQETTCHGGQASAAGSDGRSHWEIDEEDDESNDPDSPAVVQSADPALTGCDELLCPAWLPSRFVLELAGTEVIAGRPALRVLARPRPVGRAGSGQARHRPGRPAPRPAHRRIPPDDQQVEQIEVLVDSDLGILLRCERHFDGKTVSRQEVTSITLDPPEASDPGQFEVPEDPDNADPGQESPFDGPGWQAARNAASLGATALSFAIRHGGHRAKSASDGPAWATGTPAASDTGDSGQPDQHQPDQHQPDQGQRDQDQPVSGTW